MLSVDRKYFNCDQSGFTLDHIAKCPARNAECNFCQKTGHYERTCRGRRTTGRGRISLIHEGGTEGEHTPHEQEDNASNYGSYVGWVTDPNAVAHGWDSDI